MTVVAIVTTMRAFWSDPYLWIHLAGVAAVPILLELCLLGLAVGDPILPVGIEVLLVAAIGIGPILWMQWQRPFCIFSLVALALKPEQLNDQQRRLLQLFKSPINRGLAIGTAIALLLVFWQLYQIAPMVATVAPFPPNARLAGLGLAAIAFLGTNLFLQVPVAVTRVLLATDAEVSGLEPYPTERISKDFTLLGLKVNRILPTLVLEPRLAPSAALKSPRPSRAAAQAVQRGPSAAASQDSASSSTTSSEDSPWDVESPPTSPSAETISSESEVSAAISEIAELISLEETVPLESETTEAIPSETLDGFSDGVERSPTSIVESSEDAPLETQSPEIQSAETEITAVDPTEFQAVEGESSESSPAEAPSFEVELPGDEPIAAASSEANSTEIDEADTAEVEATEIAFVEGEPADAASLAYETETLETQQPIEISAETLPLEEDEERRPETEN